MNKLLEAGALAFLKRKGCEMVCTEYGHHWIGDVVGVKDNIWYEIEIKRTIYDFKADFNKTKHSYLNNNNVYGMPNYFYFLIPSKLEFKVLEELESISKQYNIVKKYGVLVYDEKYSQPWFAVKSIKKVKRLHNNLVKEWHKKGVLSRMSSEICKLYGCYQ